jgi:hypothetical protein
MKPKDVKELDINVRTRNMLLSSARCLGERDREPSDIGLITRAALVLTLFEHVKVAEKPH